MQSMLQEFGCVISTNNRSVVSVNAVYDHFDIPSYPQTSVTGIAHFVHYRSPLIQNRASSAEARKAADRQISKVCCAYAMYMQQLTT